MQIKPDTKLYLVSLRPGEAGHVSEVTLANFCNACRGGMGPTDTAVFTDQTEAEAYAEVYKTRTRLLQRIDRMSLREIRLLEKTAEGLDLPNQVDAGLGKVDRVTISYGRD
jgi:hypothetical protein